MSWDWATFAIGIGAGIVLTIIGAAVLAIVVYIRWLQEDAKLRQVGGVRYTVQPPTGPTPPGGAQTPTPPPVPPRPYRGRTRP